MFQSRSLHFLFFFSEIRAGEYQAQLCKGVRVIQSKRYDIRSDCLRYYRTVWRASLPPKQANVCPSKSKRGSKKKKERKTRTGCSFRCAVATRLRNRTRLEALPETRSQQEAARKQCFPVKTSVDGVSHSLARFARGQIYVGGVIHEKRTLAQDLLLPPLSFGELLTAGKGVQ